MSRASEHLATIVTQVPYARFLGVRFELAGDEMTALLPYAEHLIGNPRLPALHGGVIGAFMEITALAQVSVAQLGDQDAHVRQPRPIGVTVEYLRSGRPTVTFARAEIKRMGRRVANVIVDAWQERRASPIATLSARFLLTPPSET